MRWEAQGRQPHLGADTAGGMQEGWAGGMQKGWAGGMLLGTDTAHATEQQTPVPRLPWRLDAAQHRRWGSPHRTLLLLSGWLQYRCSKGTWAVGGVIYVSPRCMIQLLPVMSYPIGV